ncbi:MAG: TetR family transcriptional regulator [Oscillospiraceae bacterium]|nr:TetR family transcriptional regulator [Oscillospiraceae bacterium]
MPTQCFFNLPHEKQMKIVGSALMELSKVPADKISINQIIHNAGISRGSFYQYFNDKLDLLDYILSDFKNMSQSCFRRNLEKYNGDIFKMTRAVYEEIILLGKNEHNLKIIGNFFRGTKFTRNDRINFMKIFNISECFLEDIIMPYVEKNNLRETSVEFIRNIIGIICLLVKQSLTDIFSDYDNLEIYKNSFYTQLDIIRRGSIKE